jgi:DnaJ-domain-containing protein 1
MGIGRRLIDLARANLNALLDRAAAADGEGLSDEELRSREARDRAARERAEKRAREAAQAAGRTPRPQSSKKPPPRRSAPPPYGSEKRLRELYAQLETPYGASFDEVKKSFRRLMRKYHPDLHAKNPKKHKAATELTMQLTTAYNEIETILVKR